MRKMIVVAAVVMLAVSTLGFANGTAETTGSTSGSKEPTITAMTYLFYPTAPPANNPVQQALEAYTHTNLKIDWVPSSDYNTKVSTIIASGSLPEILTVGNWKVPYVLDAVDSGEFWNITPDIPKYNNLEAIPKQAYANVTIKGKLYGLPRLRVLDRGAILMRKDWLDNLGLKPPTTTDELYNVIKAFTNNDPNKDGKNDTVGFLMDKNLDGLDQLVTYFGGPNQWEVNNGKFTPWFMTSGYTQAMQFLKKLYDQHMMNSDFAAITGSQLTDYMNSGKGGMYIGVGDDLSSHFNPLFQAHPNVAPQDLVTAVQRIQGPDGPRLAATPGNAGLMMFPTPSIKTQDQLNTVLGFVNKLGDTKALDLMNYGILGQTYKIENGKAVITDAKLYNIIGNPFNQLSVYSTANATPAQEDPLTQEWMNEYAQDLSIAVPNPTNPLISNTYNQDGPQLNLLIQNATVKYIVGDIGQTGWNDAINQWKAQGGDKEISEYEAANAANQAH